MSEIKPCPFCGGNATLRDRTYAFLPKAWVECSRCEARGPIEKVCREAIEVWNRRADDD